MAHVKTECNYRGGIELRAGQVALDPDLSGMPRLRFLTLILDSIKLLCVVVKQFLSVYIASILCCP